MGAVIKLWTIALMNSDSICRSYQWRCATVLVLVALACCWCGAAWAGNPSGLTASGEQGPVHLPALHTDIRLEILGPSARVWVEQRFQNPGQQWLQADYRFPLPDKAAVDALTVDLGDRMILGEIREKQTARRDFRRATANGQVAALLEQQKGNVFETRISNIAPASTITVQIGFSVPVEFDQGEYQLSLPTTFMPRVPQTVAESGPAGSLPISSGIRYRPTPPRPDSHSLSLEALITTDLPLAYLESPSHQVSVHELMQGYLLSLEPHQSDAEAYRADRDFRMVWAVEAPSQPVASLFLAPSDGGAREHGLLRLTPPDPGALADLPRDVSYILDRSGSMQGDPFTQARSALEAALRLLEPDDRFNIISFSDEHHSVFAGPQPASAVHIGQALDYLRGLDSNGGTLMLPALQQALAVKPDSDKPRLRQIIFLTDGAVSDAGALYRFIEAELGSARLFTIGIGSAPNAYFMRRAARAGRGLYTRISQTDAIEEAMLGIWERIGQPLLTDLRLELPGATDVKLHPRQLPDLYAGQPLVANLAMTGLPQEIRLSGQLNGQPWQETVPVDVIQSDGDVLKLWARSEIAALEDSLLTASEQDPVIGLITDTALAYGLVTPYTSLVAVEKRISRGQDRNLQQHSIANLAPANSVMLATASGWQRLLFWGLLCLAGWILLRRLPSLRFQPGSWG